MGVTKGWDIQKKECEEVAKHGITILGFVEPWNGAHTKLMLKCEKHGEWNTTSINNFKKNGSGCNGCRADLTTERGKGNSFGNKNAISDEDHIKDFLATGVFTEGTTFVNTGVKTKGNHNCIWKVTCPVCAVDAYSKAGLGDGSFEGRTTHLKNGRVPCRCSPRHIYSKDQWMFRFQMMCEEKGYTFVRAIYEGEAYSHGDVEYTCPEHGLQCMAMKNMMTGRGCPECANKTQQFCYINEVYDEDNNLCALKFGIANDAERRVKDQNSKNAFTMQQKAVYFFEDIKSCRAAERKCLKLLKCGVVSKFQLVDGYTETTYVDNYEIIEAIYESFGGVLQK